jgi:hypothetical protein
VQPRLKGPLRAPSSHWCWVTSCCIPHAPIHCTFDILNLNALPLIMPSAMQGRPQTPVSQIIEDYASITSEDESIHSRSAPQSYQLVNVHQPNGTLTTIRRNLSAREPSDRRQAMVAPSAPRAAKGACRTVLARSSDGSWRRVQRPVRDSELFTRSRAQASGSHQIPPSASARSSSLYEDDASRGTMLSTMTMVETALAEQKSYQNQRMRGIQTHGHSANGSSATGTSGASGSTEIEIGHMDEMDEFGRSRWYSASEYGDVGGNASGVQSIERLRDGHATMYRSRSGRCLVRPSPEILERLGLTESST